ncbi:hypothetical protein B0T21DRAFT_204367 [Apiosordaria backusii]|uniref:Uncharacterized protein n=1 Tax=Apiosordaria backusii TaxID=314023 RepID=A0AA40B7A9_9PEZI|nr:hypothetical protein B0T21DRAFT_204367 [Apiosordaria backusii]
MMENWIRIHPIHPIIPPQIASDGTCSSTRQAPSLGRPSRSDGTFINMHATKARASGANCLCVFFAGPLSMAFIFDITTIYIKMGGSNLLPWTTRTSHLRGAMSSATSQSAALQPAFLRGSRPGKPFQAKSFTAPAPDHPGPSKSRNGFPRKRPVSTKPPLMVFDCKPRPVALCYVRLPDEPQALQPACGLLLPASPLCPIDQHSNVDADISAVS